MKKLMLIFFLLSSMMVMRGMEPAQDQGSIVPRLLATSQGYPRIPDGVTTADEIRHVYATMPSVDEKVDSDADTVEAEVPQEEVSPYASLPSFPEDAAGARSDSPRARRSRIFVHKMAWQQELLTLLKLNSTKLDAQQKVTEKLGRTISADKKAYTNNTAALQRLEARLQHIETRLGLLDDRLEHGVDHRDEAQLLLLLLTQEVIGIKKEQLRNTLSREAPNVTIEAVLSRVVSKVLGPQDGRVQPIEPATVLHDSVAPVVPALPLRQPAEPKHVRFSEEPRPASSPN